MSKAGLTVHEVVRITGTTARTLHHYDRIGLLKPASVKANGYRLYDQANLERLQVILFLKETGVSLKGIAELLERPEPERRRALIEHRERLLEKKRRLERTLDTFDRYLEAGTIFGPEAIDMPGPSLREQYDREAELIYGDTAAYSTYRSRMRQSERRAASEQEADLAETERRMNDIFAGLAVFMKRSPDSAEVRRRIAEWAGALGVYMDMTPELMLHVAENYRRDGRFRAYFDAFGGDGGQFADFLYAAIFEYSRSLPGKE